MYQLLAEQTPTPEVRVRIKTSVGVMANQVQWLDQNTELSKHFDFESIKLDIVFNNTTYSGVESSDFMIKFNDQPELTYHCIRFVVSGFTDNHHTVIDGVGDCAVMIRFDLFEIEHLSMHRSIQDNGTGYNSLSGESFVPSEYLGHDGVISLEFTSPVYCWLLDMQKDLCYYSS
jgi:hypothetical protein